MLLFALIGLDAGSPMGAAFSTLRSRPFLLPGLAAFARFWWRRKMTRSLTDSPKTEPVDPGGAKVSQQAADAPAVRAVAPAAPSVPSFLVAGPHERRQRLHLTKATAVPPATATSPPPQPAAEGVMIAAVRGNDATAAAGLVAKGSTPIQEVAISTKIVVALVGDGSPKISTDGPQSGWPEYTVETGDNTATGRLPHTEDRGERSVPPVGAVVRGPSYRLWHGRWRQCRGVCHGLPSHCAGICARQLLAVWEHTKQCCTVENWEARSSELYHCLLRVTSNVHRECNTPFCCPDRHGMADAWRQRMRHCMTCASTVRLALAHPE